MSDLNSSPDTSPSAPAGAASAAPTSTAPTSPEAAAPAAAVSISTALVHADQHQHLQHGSIHTPIHTSVQYAFDRVEGLIDSFQGRLKNSFSYSRQGTPTTAALEARLTLLEEGVGTICFATGMASLSATFLTLLRAGDHLVSSAFIFGNTNSLLDTLGNFGVGISRVDASSVAAVEAALRPETRMVFVEAIANPRTQVPDLEAIGRLCRERGLLFVVDNTVPSPVLFKPRVVGAGLVMNSLSKTLGGHGAALGGAITDTGEFDWSHYPNIAAPYQSLDPKQRGLTQIRKKGLRDMGASLSSEQAHRISLGLETVELRSARVSATALTLARHLEAHPAIQAVHYPMLESHAQHAIARRLFKAGSWLLSVELRDAARVNEVLNRLRYAVKATGLGDNRTLVIPVAQTIFWEAGPAVRANMGIAEGLVRVSIGLEDPADLIADFDQALA